MQLLNKIPGPRLLRACLTAFFALDGFLFASWAVRVPAVKAQVGASPAALGLALLGLSAGSIATMAITGSLCRRLGSRNVTVGSAVLLCLVVTLPAFARSALELGLALAVFGVAYGGLNVAMNSVAVDMVARLRRPVMPSFHAAWSFGGLAGSALGGLLAPHLAPRPALALMGLAGLVLVAIAGPPLRAAERGRARAADLPGAARTGGAAGPDGDGAAVAPRAAEPPAAARRAGRWHRPGWRLVVLFGLIAACAAYGEGAVADWGALHLKQDLGASAGLAAAGYAAFAIAEACGRLAGTALLARLGQTRVLAGGGIAACAGMLAAVLAPDVPVALAGFALTGLGVANMFPAAMTQAGLAEGPRGVAAASTLGYGGLLLGPPTIGFLASAAGLPAGLAMVCVLALAAAVLAVVAGREAPAAG
ncbi:MAG TPA: MFS transporter [Trebonia sp.]|nr:MFS transporter [Trebonia sp.]